MFCCQKPATILLLAACLGFNATSRGQGQPSTSPGKNAGQTNTPSSSPAHIPLCTGLTIVTAISQREGDYESIKTIESVNDREVRLKYSAERMVADDLSDEPPKLTKWTLYRKMRVEDLANANLYEQQFSDLLPELIPETTAIGTSTAVLNALRTKGEAEIGFFIAFSGEPTLEGSRNMWPNIYANGMIATIKRIEPTPVMLPILVNNVRVELPAIHAGGEFDGDQTDFYFLDDPLNPITLKFRYGIDAVKIDDEKRDKTPGGKKTRDRDDLQVTKISYRCGEIQQSATNGNSDLEKTLAATGTAEVYDIYFTFNSDQIREESEPRLKDIADVLTKHADWKISVDGHTDSIGSAASNLDLSRRRAAAVKDALVRRYHIDAGRLTTAGYGASRPKDTNDTLEGRAHNRRVELSRQ
jgi:outer membrane protein OmpA-like peptidoglycan-associated protein